MRIFTIIKEFAQSVSRGFGLFFSERGSYAETAYTPALQNRKK